MTKNVGAEESGNHQPISSPEIAVSSASPTSESDLLRRLSYQVATHSDAASFGINRTIDREKQFLGPTSYSAVFHENQDSLGSEFWGNGDDSPSDLKLVQKQGVLVRSKQVAPVVEALANFPDRKTCDFLLSRYLDIWYVIPHQHVLEHCHGSLWGVYGAHLQEPRNHDRLKQMADSLLRKTAESPGAFKSSAEWLKTFSGTNLRLEIIANLLTTFALAVFSLPDWHPRLFQSVEGKRAYVRRLGGAAETCQAMFLDEPRINEFTVWSLHHFQILQSLYSGDDSHLLWQRSGHVATAIMALGMHREEAVIGAAPLLVSEIRKRIYACAFSADKAIATFTGRPPRLSRRYSSCQLPLDLNDEQLMTSADELSANLQRLDAEGWNHGGVANRVTHIRGFMVASLIRDEILELCLGANSESSESRRQYGESGHSEKSMLTSSRELLQRSDAAYMKLPPCIRFDGEWPAAGPPNLNLMTQIMLKFDFLLNRFLLLRPSKSDKREDRQLLIDTAKEMLADMVLFLRHRPRFADFHVDFSWSVVSYGIPSAGVLGVELLKQSRTAVHDSLSLPRSETIQQLSLFMLCLEAVAPYEGNYAMSARMHKVIGRILDSVLEPTSAAIVSYQGTPSEQEQFLADVDWTNAIGPKEDAEFLDWLNSVDWITGPLPDSF